MEAVLSSAQADSHDEPPHHFERCSPERAQGGMKEKHQLCWEDLERQSHSDSAEVLPVLAYRHTNFRETPLTSAHLRNFEGV